MSIEQSVDEFLGQQKEESEDSTLEPIEGGESPPEPEDDGEEKSSLRDFIEQEIDQQEQEGEQETVTPEPRAAKGKAFSKGGKSSTNDPNAKDYVPAPASMNNEEKEIFRTAPPALQNFLARREKEIRSELTRTQQGIAEIARRYKGLDSVVEKYEAKYVREGKPIEQVVQKFLEWDQYFEKDKHEAAKALLSAYDIDPEELAHVETELADTNDPEIAELRQHISRLESMLTQQDSQRQQAVAQEREQSAQAALDQFMQAKDESGALLYPYWEEVQEEIAELLPTVVRRGATGTDALVKAYQMVAATNPDLQKAINQYRQSSGASARVRQNRQITQKAQYAASSVKGSPMTTGTVTSIPRDTRSVLEGLLDGSIPHYER